MRTYMGIFVSLGLLGMGCHREIEEEPLALHQLPSCDDPNAPMIGAFLCVVPNGMKNSLVPAPTQDSSVGVSAEPTSPAVASASPPSLTDFFKPKTRNGSQTSRR